MRKVNKFRPGMWVYIITHRREIIKNYRDLIFDGQVVFKSFIDIWGRKYYYTAINEINYNDNYFIVIKRRKAFNHAKRIFKLKYEKNK